MDNGIVLSSDDKDTLELLFGSATYERGLEYARDGAVLIRESDPKDGYVSGQVQGQETSPYIVSVTLFRSPSNLLTMVDSACTCPVSTYCKHAVALLLAKDPPTGSPNLELISPQLNATFRDRTPDKEPTSSLEPSRSGDKGSKALADWAGPLEFMLEPEDPREFEQQEIGLLFELVRSPGGSPTGQPGIRVHPVVPTRNGRWAKTGTSWRNIEYIGNRFSRSPLEAQRLTLLKELLGLSQLAGNRMIYFRTNDTVNLEEINSRRIWDLLSEARAIGLPLLRAVRGKAPAALPEVSVSFTIDVTRQESGIRVEPRISASGMVVPSDKRLLIGTPAHGIAWWEGEFDAQGRGQLIAIAPLSPPIDEGIQRLLSVSSIDVPHDDEERFMNEFVPKLQRRVDLTSGDGSVKLPEMQAAALILSIYPGNGDHIEVRWARGVEGGKWREDLYSAASRKNRGSVVDSTIDAATAIARLIPELMENGPFGERLSPISHLDGMLTVRFVTEVLPALKELEGITIEYAAAIADYCEATDAPVVELGGSASFDNDWFDLEVTLRVGSEEVPFTDVFLALANGESHLILPSGTYFSLDREDLQELALLIAEARSMHEIEGDIIRLSKFSTSFWEELERLGVVSKQAREWKASLSALLEAGKPTIHPAPESLTATLRPYQLVGFNWLVHLFESRLGGILADDMGLGKTLQALAMICHAKEKGPRTGPFLVLAPTSVVGNWESECRRFAPQLSVCSITKTGRRSEVHTANLANDADLIITSYGLFRTDYAEYEGIQWAGVFLDEAQFVKNYRSKTYQKVKMLPVSFKVAMSGTPIENNLMELWSLLSITAPGLYVNPDQFSLYYRVPIEKRSDAERLAKLRRRIRPLMLRRTKEQVASDLPEKQEQVLELELSPKHRRIYETYLQRERQKVLGLIGYMSKNRFEIFKSLTLLRQASLDLSLVDPEHFGVSSTKLDVLMEMLEEIVADGHRVLVFSQFTRFLTMARNRIRAAGISHSYLDGRTRDRPAAIAEFREGSAKVFLISLKAGGFGLNLTEADYCILLDPWWNPATEAQAVDRTHRIGQTRKVMVYRLVAKDTIEEKVMSLKARKAALFANVIDGGEFESGAMTAEDVRELLG